MATHSSILAWEIPWTEEPNRATVHGVTKESDTTEQLSLSLFPVITFQLLNSAFNLGTLPFFFSLALGQLLTQSVGSCVTGLACVSTTAGDTVLGLCGCLENAHPQTTHGHADFWGLHVYSVCDPVDPHLVDILCSQSRASI